MNHYVARRINASSEEELMAIIDELHTCLSDDLLTMVGDIDVQGPLDVHQLARELFIFGADYERIETELGIIHPFGWVIIPEGMPHDLHELEALMDAKEMGLLKDFRS